MDDEQKTEILNSWKPNKQERIARRRAYDRWRDMRDDPLRKAAELDWDAADKDYQMYVPDIDPEDWRSHLELPDAFAAIQTSMQETIERKSRPFIVGTDGDGDDPAEKFKNTVMNWNMTRTGFDLQYFYAKLNAAIRGTSWIKNYYREEKRTVKDLVDVDKDGNLVYKEKEITDFDDDYTEWIDNQFVFIDPAAKTIDEASDCIEREILPIDKFRFKYSTKKDFKNIDFVHPGGDTGRTSFFQVPTDLNANEVEILHYYNRDTDDYIVVANNIVIRSTPLPTKHKELPFAVLYHYRVPGRFWGLGIPKVIKYLSEERKALRRLNLDRQKINLAGFWLVNDAFDLDEEETQSRPGGMLGVNTNGAPLNNVIQRVDLGDVSSSYFKTEEILLEDIRRAHGIDDRIVTGNQATTATQAAIAKESILKRINMVSILAEIDTIVRIGRLKWSNIQFFYKAPRYETIYEEGDERVKKIDRHIVVEGLSFSITKDPGTQKDTLEYEEIDGKSIFKLDKKLARFLDGDTEITMDSTVQPPMSKAIKQAKTTEMLTAFASNPLLFNELDAQKVVKRVVEINDEDPDDWMKNPTDPEKMKELADLENYVMKSGTPLQGTEKATIEHTNEHLIYTQSAEFQTLAPEIQQIFINHIMEEHDNNPLTGSSADAMGAFGLGGQQAPTGPQNTVQGAPAPSIQPQVPGQAQMADITPANNNPAPQ